MSYVSYSTMDISDIQRIVSRLYPGIGWFYAHRSQYTDRKIFKWACSLPKYDITVEEQKKLVLLEYGGDYYRELAGPLSDVRVIILDLVTRIIMNKKGEVPMSNYKFNVGEVVYHSDLQANVKIADIYKDHIRYVTLVGRVSDILSKDKDSILEYPASHSLTIGNVYRIGGGAEVEVIGFDSKRNEVIVRYLTTTDNKRYAYKSHELRPRNIQLVNGGIYDIEVNGTVAKVKVLGIDKVYVYFIDTELREFSVRTNQIGIGFGTMKVLKQYEV